MADMTISPTND
jgi:prepilin-type N-terminal cleavage/methylation domain-containing protein